MVERIQGLCNAFYLTISGTSHCRCRCHYYCCSCYGLSSKSRRLRRFVKHRHRRRRSSRDGWKIEGILARTPADDSDHHRTRTRIRPLPYCCCSLTASAIFIPEVSCSPPPPTRPVLPAPHLRYSRYPPAPHNPEQAPFVATCCSPYSTSRPSVLSSRLLVSLRTLA